MQILKEQLNFEYYFDILNFDYYTRKVSYFKYFGLLAILTLYSQDSHSSREEVLLNCFEFSIKMDWVVKRLTANPYWDCKIFGFNSSWIDHWQFQFHSHKLFLLEIQEDGNFSVLLNLGLLFLVLFLLLLFLHRYLNHLISCLFYPKVISMLFHLFI